jgi:DNA-binding NarL/FixJ family response regulator
MDNNKTKVVIVEDHKLFREGLKSLLADKDDLEVVGEAGDGLAAIKTVKRCQPDMILLDLSMPKMNGISVMKEIKSQYKEISDMLHISVKTVEKHRANIMNKLDLHNAAALTAYAIEHGLVMNKG